MTHTTPFDAAPSQASALARAAILVYGVTCYALGVSGLVALIAVTLGLVPFTGGPLHVEGTAARVLVDVGLVALFGIQHAIMARPGFKARWRRALPEATERPTFTLMAGLLAGLAVWLWQPVGGTLWSAEAPALRGALLAGCALGWTYLLASTFAIDHFELFGLRQVWRNLRGLETEPPSFKARFMYRFDRHPIMTGALIGFWCTPDLTVDHALLAGAFTLYMIIGVTLEERDLVRAHGERYRAYARKVRTIVPRLARIG